MSEDISNWPKHRRFNASREMFEAGARNLIVDEEDIRVAVFHALRSEYGFIYTAWRFIRDWR